MFQTDLSNISFGMKKLGGLIGYNSGNTKSYVINSYNAGDINFSDANNPAGLVGYNHGGVNTLIYNSYNIGNNPVNGITTVSASNVSTLALNNVYNISNSKNLGVSLLGENTIINIKNAYYKNDTIKKGTNLSNDIELTIGKSESEMKNQSFVNTLNENKKTIDLSTIDSDLSKYTLCDWKLGTTGYPELDCK